MEACRRRDGVEVVILGTNHLSDQDALDVGDVVRRTRPNTTVVELCSERAPMLARRRRRAGDGDSGSGGGGGGDAAPSALDTSGSFAKAVGDWTELISMMYTSAEVLLGRETGAEFSEAVAAAEEVGSAVVLGDRPQSVTLGRMRALVPFYEILLPSISQYDQSAADAVERSQLIDACLRDVDALDPTHIAFAEADITRRRLKHKLLQARQLSALDAADASVWRVFRRFWKREAIDVATRDELRWAVGQVSHADPSAKQMPPSMRAVLMDERDQVLARAISDAKGPRVVAVVGAAHVNGIKAALTGGGVASNAELEEYHTVPPWRPRWHHGCALAVTAIAGVGMARSPTFRRGVGVATVGIGVSAGWLLYEVHSRVQHFKRASNLDSS